MGKTLRAKYCGPYVVLELLGHVDYLVSTPYRRKTKGVVHVNLMLKYREQKVDCLLLGDVVNVAPVTLVETHGVVVEQKGSVTEIKFACLLDGFQNDELKSVLNSFTHVFTVVQEKTTMITHKIELLPGGRPVRQTAYGMHPDRLRKVHPGIEELLRMGVIEESDSPWVAPILVVSKPDN